MSRFTTLADLWRANADIMVECECGRFKKLQAHQLSTADWSSTMAPIMEAEPIEPAVAKLKCSECGGRVKSWSPVVRLHYMATG